MRVNAKKGLTAWYALVGAAIAYAVLGYLRWMFQFFSFDAGDRAIALFESWIRRPFIGIGVLALLFLFIKYPGIVMGDGRDAPLTKLGTLCALLILFRLMAESFKNTYGWAEFPVAVILLLGLAVCGRVFPKVLEDILLGRRSFTILVGAMVLIGIVNTWVINA